MYCANASHVIALVWQSREDGSLFWLFFVARKKPIPYIENRRATLPMAVTARLREPETSTVARLPTSAFWRFSLFRALLSQIGRGHRMPHACAYRRLGARRALRVEVLSHTRKQRATKPHTAEFTRLVVVDARLGQEAFAGIAGIGMLVDRLASSYL